MKREPRTVVCSICSANFQSRGLTPRHKCSGTFQGQTGTGRDPTQGAHQAVPLDPATPLALGPTPGDITLVGDDEPEPEPGLEPGQVEPLPEPQQDPERPKVVPPTPKADQDRLQAIVDGLYGCLDKQLTPDEEKKVISSLLAGTASIRIDATEIVISGQTYGYISGAIILGLLVRRQLGGFLGLGLGMFGLGETPDPEPEQPDQGDLSDATAAHLAGDGWDR